MIAEVIKILPYQKSVNGNSYMRIFLKTDDGSFLKTDICPGFRNFKRWRKVARVGNKLANLKLKDAWTVDADSTPLLLTGRQVLKQTEEDHLKELAQQGVFG